MVSKEEIRQLGKLSKLELTDQEVERYQSQIEEIIAYFDILDSISLNELEPMHLIKNFSELRKDCQELFKGNALKNVKYRKDDYIKGPRLA